MSDNKVPTGLVRSMVSMHASKTVETKGRGETDKSFQDRLKRTPVPDKQYPVEDKFRSNK